MNWFAWPFRKNPVTQDAPHALVAGRMVGSWIAPHRARIRATRWIDPGYEFSQ
jgi:hypothetical protein